jgi:hypothetical protein
MATTKPAERVRLSLDVSARVRAQLENLESRTEAGSITEVVRRALSLYDLVIEHQEEGGKLVFRHSDGEEELLRVL